mmetsp:Transcript_7808/g.11827  ORF Transcript_7808/g.11827 Transcript_7808/m.11827 type:complete len:624 (-) Transcript_7808:34-1905(-)
MKASEFGLKVFLFIWHICVFTFWVILLRFVRDEDGEYTFNPVSVIVLTELCKFLLSFIFHCYSEGYGSQSSISKVFYELRSHWTQGKFFAVPALIYAVYNSLLFFNLKNFDPTAYKVLINIRILWSGLLFQIFFGKKLGVRRWAALCLLAIACAINQINDDFELNVPLTAFIGVIVQSFTSSLGGVYSEFYLKKQNKLSMNVKNIYLYGFSVVFNLAWIVVGQPSIVTNPAQFFQGFSGFVVLIVFLGSFAGFSTALFLRYLNLILKEYAHSGELFLTAFLSWMFFGTELNWRVLASIFLVSVSVIIYNTAPDHQNSTDSSSSSSSSSASSTLSNKANASSSSSAGQKSTQDDYTTLIGHSGAVFGLSFSPDSRFLLSGSEDNTVRLWSLESNNNLVAYTSHNYPVWDVDFSPVGCYFATASHDRTARLFSTERVYAQRIFIGHLADVDTVKFHPNCNYIATGSSDKTVRLWHVQTGECVRIFTGHSGMIHDLAFSVDGKTLASCSSDKTCALWDLASGRRIAEFHGHRKDVWSVDFSKGQSNLLASASADQTVRLWNVAKANQEFRSKGGAQTLRTSTKRKRKLPQSPHLIESFPTKSTPVYNIKFTNRNLLLATGVFTNLG